MLEAYLSIDDHMDDVMPCALPRGSAALFSRRSHLKESENEDAAAVLVVSEETFVLAVADGAGGMRAGARASQTAIDELARLVRESSDSDGLREAILKAFDCANRGILEAGVGAGTTFAVALVENGAVRFFHVGDSMIVLMGQRGRIRYQTTVHSPVGYAVESGLLDEKDAMHHADRHLVSNIVGSEDMAVEMGPSIRLRPYDTLLLASDGLFDNLHLHEIIERSRKGPLLRVVGGLAEESLRRMVDPAPGQPSKPDDLTIVAFRLGRSRGDTKDEAPAKPQ